MSGSKPWSSIAFQVAVRYGALVTLTVAVVLGLLYVQMLGTMRARLDRYIDSNLHRLEHIARTAGMSALEHEAQRMLNDGINSDIEVLIVTDPNGHALMGNASLKHPRALSRLGRRELAVVRRGETHMARVQTVHLDGGDMLIVGTDIRPLEEMEHLFARASAWTALVSALIIGFGAAGFRRLVEERATHIRNTLTRVAAGRLDERIAENPRQRDEFTLLARDINHMLDQLQSLMDGIRDVSNTIAHNLRTPLTRMRLRLEDMRLRATSSARSPDLGGLAPDLETLSDELLQVSTMFERLLAIAKVEAGALRLCFETVSVETLLMEAVDLYEPMIDDPGGHLSVQIEPGLRCQGDANLLASALSNLIENALKYGRSPDGELRIHLAARTIQHKELGRTVEISVSDQGPGVAPQDLERLPQRFFQANLDHRGLGLGLASVQAIVQAHAGQLIFDNTHPGLRARLLLPTAA